MLMAPEGFNGSGSGGDRKCGAVEKFGVVQSGDASVLMKSSINVCSSSLLSKKGPSWWKIADATSEVRVEDTMNHVNFGITMTPMVGDNQPQKRSGKLARENNGSCKRSRLAQVEISASESVLENVKGNSSEPVTEFSHVSKQKNISKRGEKRNGKAMKNRGDMFSLKNGLVSFSSAAGGNSFLGAYGSKPDLFDVTKHIDDLSLNELLDGSYKCPIYSEGKGKKVPTSNEKLLLSVRKACSIIKIQKNASSPTISATDKISVELGSSSSSRCDTGNGDAQTAECTSLVEVPESNKNINSPMLAVNLPLNQPKDVLHRLSLPPSKDLDSLLLDATKPSLSSRNNSDLRLGKLASWRSGLPPFPFSQSSSTHAKSGSDAVKLTSSRNSCQGRWVKVENSVNHPNDSPRIVVDLESLTFDRSLVPSLTRKTPPSEPETAPSESFGLPTNQIVNSSALCSTSHDQPDEHSPSVLSAARTLYEISSSVVQNLPEKQKKPSEKQLSKIYKSKAKNRESGYHQFGLPKSTAGSDSISNADVMVRSKKLKLSTDVRNNIINGAYPSKKVQLNPSTLQSVRSSPTPGKSSTPEMRNVSSNVLNRSCTMPPPSSRVMNNASGSWFKL